MSILSIFPPLPPRGNVTTAEHNGQLIYAKAQQVLSNNAPMLPDCPKVSLSSESARSSVSHESARSAFLVQDRTTLRRVLRAWYEQGVTGALEELGDSGSDHDDRAMSYLHRSLKFINWVMELQTHFFPYSKLTPEELIAKFSPVRYWMNGYTRALAWHPHTNKLALAQRDDSIKVYSPSNDLIPLLKYKLQRNITDLHWQPFSSSILAVGCQSGVLIWNIEPMSLATRPSASSVQVLQVKNHAPVTSVSWSPSGTLLVSASPNDMAMLVWDVVMETYVPLRRVGGGGLTRVQWSPDGSKVFSATTSNVFRVWETISWSCEKWSNLSAYCQASCWSPDGSVLLFCTSDEPIIYSLTFSSSTREKSSAVGGSSTAVKCADLSETSIEREDGEVTKVGGNILSMVWDSSGERLAVTFQGQSSVAAGSSTAGAVALFRTRLSPVLELLPCGFVVGDVDELPEHVSFQSRYEHGAILCVVWSSSRMCYVPLNFISSHTASVDQYKASRMSHVHHPSNPQTIRLHTTNLAESTLDAVYSIGNDNMANDQFGVYKLGN